MSTVDTSETVESTIHWRIENFSSVIDAAMGVAVLSPVFQTTHPHYKKLSWKLKLYPGGFNEENKEYMGLCLCYLGEWQTLVAFNLYILSGKQKTGSLASSQGILFKKNRVCGINQFCLKTMVRDETMHLLANDTLVISGTITVKNLTLHDEHDDADGEASAHFEKLLKNGDMSDVTFEIGQEKMRLHKAIVTSLSPVFLAMFQHQMKEKESSVVQITDVKYEVMKELFRYVYARKVKNIERIAEDLLVAADKYDVKRLKLKCENILSQSLNVDNALGRLEWAVKYNTTILKSKAIEFIVSRLKEFVNRPEFDQMDGICKGELLRAMA